MPAACAASTKRRSEAGDLALEVMVGLQALIDHRALERVLVDGDDGSGRRLTARRVPGRPTGDEQHEVGILQERLDAGPQVQRMVLREIGEGGAPADRDAEEIGELDQCREGCGIAAGTVGQDHWIAGGDQQFGDLLDIGVGGPSPGWRRDPARVLARRPFLEHHFERGV